MMPPMDHDAAFERLDALAVDTLDAAERDAIEAHLATCESCRRELAQLRETAAMLAFAVAAESAASSEEAANRGRVLARLMARAAVAADGAVHAGDASSGASRDVSGDASGDAAPVRVLKPSRRAISALAWRRAEWMAIAAGVLLVVSVAVLASVLRDRQDLRIALAEQVARGQRAASSEDSLRTAVMRRDSIIAGLTGRDVAMMTLTSNGARSPYAHMFWDRAHDTWTLVAHNMPTLKAGRTYQLWLVTADGKVSAGTFMARDGDAMMRTTMPLSDKLMALTVTEEPMGGMPQPTGSMVMAASAH